MPSHIKTYDGSEDLEDHLKIFQAAAKKERWAMPTWCHMFNSTLTGNARVWFDDLPPESIDSYDDLKNAFLENYLQQKKCIKDPLEIHNIKQLDGESTEDFVKRGEVVASNHERKKSFPSWKQQEGNQKQNFKKGGGVSGNSKGKFKAPPPMTTPVEKRNHAKFCEFYREVGHSTDECMHLKKQIEEMIKAGKLLHLVKELKQNSGKEQPKAVLSTAHGILKLLVEEGVITLKSSKLVPLECALVYEPEGNLPAVKRIV
ncbi:reverse transcriptase domain-containing protein [Tanacetum coccineum]